MSVSKETMVFNLNIFVTNVKKKWGSEEMLENARMIAAKAEKMWVECDVNVSESECVVCVHFYNTSLGNRQFKQTSYTNK